MAFYSTMLLICANFLSDEIQFYYFLNFALPCLAFLCFLTTIAAAAVASAAALHSSVFFLIFIIVFWWPKQVSFTNENK